MQVIETIEEMRQWSQRQKRGGLEVGLVPTMGFLHQGHLSLVKRARLENDAVVLSIFVNPLQFGPQEDFSTYPRDFVQDCRLAQEAGVDVVFAPLVKELYPDYPPLTTVEVKGMTDRLCGASRPGHFTGVATVVTKLFNAVQPERAYFGQKDYQQVLVIKRMILDLNSAVHIKMVPIMREPDGLAMSSRNTYLNEEERQQARCLYQSLEMARKLFEQGERKAQVFQEAIKTRIKQESKAEIDYIEVCDAHSLGLVTELTRPAVIALAVKIGKTRLIDNMIMGGE